MHILQNSYQVAFGVAVFINATLLIPQAINIIKERSVRGVSLITFVGFLTIQILAALYGFSQQNLFLVFICIVSAIPTGFNVLLIFMYRNLNFHRHNLYPEDIIEQLPGHIYWKSKDGTFLGSNTNNWKNFGMKSLSEYIGKNDYDWFEPKEAQRIRRADQKVLSTGKQHSFEEISTTKSKQQLFLSIKRPLLNRRKKLIGILGISIDITKTRQKEMARLYMLENIIAIMPGHVYWINKDQKYLGCNDNQAHSIGLKSRKEIIGKRNRDIPHFFIPDVLDKNNQYVLKTGEPITVEEPAKLLDGTNAIFMSNKVPIKDKHGNITGMVGISFDVTKEKREALIEKNISEQTTKNLRILAASIAHEMRTPLAVIDGLTATMERVIPEIEQYCENQQKHAPSKRDLIHLSGVPKELSDITHHTNMFIDMLLKNVNETAPINLKILTIENVVNAALKQYPKKQLNKIQIDLTTTPNFMLNGNQESLIHILFNLLKNAIHYVEKAGKGGIKIWTERGDAYNILHFKDTGSGIPKEQLPRIFDHFYSKTRHGTGVGLAYCKMTMDNLGGSICCDSILGKYTHFQLRFPAMNRAKP